MRSSSPRLAALLNATFGNAPELIILVLTVNAGLINVAKGDDHRLGARQHPADPGPLAGRRRPAPRAPHVREAAGRRERDDAHARRGARRAADSVRADPGTPARATRKVVRLRGRGDPHAAHLRRVPLPLADRAAGGPGREPRALDRARRAHRAGRLGRRDRGALRASSSRRSRPTIRETGVQRDVRRADHAVPALGNIAEHLSAVRLAWRCKLDFSMGIVFNSGLQVALLITAAAVLAGIVTGHDVDDRLPAARAGGARCGRDHGGVRDARRRGGLDRGPRARGDPYVLAALSFWFL